MIPFAPWPLILGFVLRILLLASSASSAALSYGFDSLLNLPSSLSLRSSCYPDKVQNCKANHDVTWKKSHLRLFLFTRKNTQDPELLHLCGGHLPVDSNFNPNNTLIVFFPGFLLGTCEIYTIRYIKDELLKKGDFNVVMLDVVDAYGPDYSKAVKKNIHKVAKQMTHFLENIKAETGIRSENIYLIGHSLGAQVAGLVGRNVRVHRITGLDPANVMFDEIEDKDVRLDADDADLVDVIHCNGGAGLPFFGINYPTGDADFYVNGGVLQPNCKQSIWNHIKNFEFLVAVGEATLPTTCAHHHCLIVYLNSINGAQYPSWNCRDYDSFKNGTCDQGQDNPPVILGYNFDKSFTQEQRDKPFPRKYYVDTTEE